MPDIFDTLIVSPNKTFDVFDKISKPKGDIFDRLDYSAPKTSLSPTPPGLQLDDEPSITGLEESKPSEITKALKRGIIGVGRQAGLGLEYLAQELKQKKRTFSFEEALEKQFPALHIMPENIPEKLESLGKRMVKSSEEYLKSRPDLAIDPELEKKPWYEPKRLAVKAVETAPLTVAGMGAGTVAGLVTKNPFIAAGISSTMFGLTSAGEIFKEAKEAGMKPEDALKSARLGGLGEGVLEFVPGYMFMRLLKIGKPLSKTVLTEGVKELSRISQIAKGMGQIGLAEGIEEGLQTAKDNLIARNYYEPERPLLKDVPESVALGGIMGVGLGGAGSVAGQVIGRTLAKGLTIEQPAKDEVPKFEPEPEIRTKGQGLKLEPVIKKPIDKPLIKTHEENILVKGEKPIIPQQSISKPIVEPIIKEEIPTTLTPKVKPRGIIPTKEIWDKTPSDVQNEWSDVIDYLEESRQELEKQIKPLKTELASLKGRGHKERKEELRKQIDELTMIYQERKGEYEQKSYDTSTELRNEAIEKAKQLGLADEGILEAFADDFLLESSPERPYIEVNYQKTTQEIFDEVLNRYLSTQQTKEVIASEETKGKEAQEPLPIKPLSFVSVQDARSWIKQKSKEYGGRNQFLASKEYEEAYPEVKRVFDEQKQKGKEDVAKAGEVKIVKMDNGRFAIKYIQSQGYVASGGGLYGGLAEYNTEAEAIEKANKLKLTIKEEQGTSPDIQELPTGEVAPGISKEPWQMTRDTYLKAQSVLLDGKEAFLVNKITPAGMKTKAFEISGAKWFSRNEGDHEYLIKQAISEGKPVPPEVLKDYPELQLTKEGERNVEAVRKEAIQSDIPQGKEPEQVPIEEERRGEIERSRDVQTYGKEEEIVVPGEAPTAPAEVIEKTSPEVSTKESFTSDEAMINSYGEKELKVIIEGNYRARLKELAQLRLDKITEEIKPIVKSNIGTLDKIDTIALSDVFKSEIDKNTPLNKITVKKIVAEKLGISVGDLIPEKGYKHKAIEEAYEYAIVKKGREIAQSDISLEKKFEVTKEIYNKQLNLSERTSTSIEKQQYSTPLPLAMVINQYLDIDKNTSVYEPTAGNGILLIGANPKNTVTNEIVTDYRQIHLKDSGFNTIQGNAMDFIKNNPDMDKSFDTVVMNPPFGNAEIRLFDNYRIRKLEHQIALESLKAMKDNGNAAIIIGGHNFEHGKMIESDRVFLNYLYSHYNVTHNIDINGDVYRRMGTSFPIRLLTVEGRKTIPDNHFAPTEQSMVESANTFYDVRNLLGKPIQKEMEVKHEDIRKEPIADRLIGKESTRVEGIGEGRQKSNAPTGSVRATIAGTGISDTGVMEQPGHSEGITGGIVGKKGEQQGSRATTEVARGEGVRSEELSGRVPPKQPRLASGNIQDPYIPQSKGNSGKNLIPKNLVEPIARILQKIENTYGDVDTFVQKELQYKSKEELYKALSAEQIDAVSVIISNIKDGKSIILGDQTGVGKGRVVAATIRYANNQGIKPIFFTEKPNLFSDIHRDLVDINHKVNPFILHSDISAAVLDKEGKRVFNQSFVGESKNKMIHNPTKTMEDYDVLMTTYSQVNKENKQRSILKELAQNNIIILDESHNAAGASNTGQFLSKLLEGAKSVVYSSATYAKRPDNMAVYHKTDIGKTGMSVDELTSAIKMGGIPLQQWVASGLAGGGQYTRTELDYSGTNLDIVVDVKNESLHTKQSDDITSILRDIVAFDKDKLAIIKEMDKEAVREGKRTTGEASTAAGVTSSNFSSVIHNIVSQLLLSFRADTAVENAIIAAKEGRKPVITLMNTMESFLVNTVAEGGINIGDPIGFTFKDILKKSLKGTLRYTEISPGGERFQKIFKLDELPETAQNIYRSVENKIDLLKTSLPASPIDYIKSKIEKAGYTVGEITNRKLYVDYSKSTPTLEERTEKERRDRNATIHDFNSGKTKILIFNAAGATGISLHSSEKFATAKEQRELLIVQPQLNIDTFKQAMGRVFRKGQVSKPRFTMIQTALPAEIRPTVILQKKLASLNANTTANKESSAGLKDVPDMMNPYGDSVVVNYLKQNPEINDMLGDPLDLESDTDKTGDAMQKVTGKVALLPVQMQRLFYDDIEMNYKEIIEHLEQIGENNLHTKEYNFQSKTLEKQITNQGSDESNPFASSTYLEKISVKVLKKPFTKAKIEELVKDSLKGKTAETFNDELLAKIKEVTKQYEDTLEGELVEKRKEEIQYDVNLIDYALGKFKIGYSYSIPIIENVYTPAVLVDIKHSKTSGNPAAPSKAHLVFAAAPPYQIYKTSLSRKEFISHADSTGEGIPEEWDELIPKEIRENRYVITGNLLQGFQRLGSKAETINYTTESGETKSGILLPRSTNIDSLKEGGTTVGAKEAFEYLKTHSYIESSNKEVTIRVGNTLATITVPKSKSDGAKYYLNKPILSVLEVEFSSFGNSMRSHASIDQLLPLLETLEQETNTRFSIPAKEVKETEEKVSKTVDEYIGEFTPPVGLSIKDITKVKQVNDEIQLATPKDLESTDPKVEREMVASEGLQYPSVLDKLTDVAVKLKHEFTRHFEYLNPKTDGKIMDMLRVYEALPRISKLRTIQILRGITYGFGSKKMRVFSRYLVLGNELRNFKNGIPFKFRLTEDIARADFEKYQEIINNNSDIKEAIDKRNGFMEALRSELISNKLLPEAVAGQDYWHQQTLAVYAEKQFFSGRRQDVRLDKKTWQHGRTLTEKNYNTKYFEAEQEVIQTAIESLETKKLLNKLKSLVDQSVKIKAEAKIISGQTGKEEDIILKELMDEKGLVGWRVKKGTQFYKAVTVNEKALDEAIEGTRQLTEEDKKYVFAAGRAETWIIPEHIAKTFDSLRVDLKEGMPEQISEYLLSSWKQAILFQPLRFAKYFVNNLSGDLDITFAFRPQILKPKYLLKSINELFAHYRGKAMTGDLIDFAKRDGVSSGMTIQEIPDVTEQGIFKLMSKGTGNPIGWYFNKVKNVNTLRENFLRYAAYRFFLENTRKGVMYYAASNKNEIDAMPRNTDEDIKDIAAKLARELLGDYGNTSIGGQYIAKRIHPFWRWVEINTPRYARLLVNSAHDYKQEGRQKSGWKEAKTWSARGTIRGVTATSRFLITALTMYGAIEIWNRTASMFMPGDFPSEDELSEAQRKQKHLILGRNADGTIRTIRAQGALSDVFNWLGINELIEDVHNIAIGQGKSVLEIAKDVVFAPIQNFAQGIHPVAKTTAEVIYGKTFYPDLAHPRPIRDKIEAIAKLWALDMPYRHIAGKPTIPLKQEIRKLLLYDSDAGESAYYTTRGIVSDFKKKYNVETPAVEPTNKSNALYYYKKAIILKDKKAEDKYLKQYGELGGTYKGLKASIAMANPFYGIPLPAVDQLWKEASEEQKSSMVRGMDWYRKVYEEK